MSTKSTKTTAIGRHWIAAIIVVALTAMQGTAGLAAEKVTLSHAGATLLRLPLYVAIQNGYFKDEGIDLEIVSTRSGSAAMKMLAGGSVNFSTGQLLDAVNLNKQDIHVRGVAMLTQRLSNSIVVRKALADKVKSMKDLKGRTVGVTSVGSGTWQFAVFIASLEGMKKEELNFIGVGAGPNVIGAIKSGRVDAMSYADPENLKLVQDGDAAFLVDMTDEATHKRLVGDTYLNNQVMVLKKYAESNPQQVQGFVNAIQRAINWVNSHTVEENAKVIHGFPAFSKLTPAHFLTSVKRALPGGVAKTVEVSKNAFNNAMKFPLAVGALKTPMAYDRLIDDRFAKNAVKKYPPAGR